MYSFVDEVVTTVEKVLKAIKSSNNGNRKRSKSFNLNNESEPFTKQESIKFQDIAHKDFIIKETVRTAVKTTK